MEAKLERHEFVFETLDEQKNRLQSLSTRRFSVTSRLSFRRRLLEATSTTRHHSCIKSRLMRKPVSAVFEVPPHKMASREKEIIELAKACLQEKVLGPKRCLRIQEK
jgi:hypothetical protein